MQETQEMRVRSLGWEDSLEEEIATHSSVLAWEIPWTEEPGSLQSMELQRLSDYACMHTDQLGPVGIYPSQLESLKRPRTLGVI